MSKKKPLPAPLFLLITAALAALLILVLIYAVMSWGAYFSLPKDRDADRYYFNTEYDPGDHFMTRDPSLGDILAGPIIGSSDPSLGDKRAPVVIVEYSDFLCDYCQAQEQILKKITAEFEYQVRLIWKDYPEPDPASASYRAALAARCAGEQGRFWQYHDFLYEFNNRLSRDTYLEIAGLLELDQSDFAGCIDNQSTKDLIDDNIKEANALGINGVPFLYVNDQEILGEIGYEELKRIVELELGR